MTKVVAVTSHWAVLVVAFVNVAVTEVTFLQTVVRSDSQALAWNEVRSLAAAQRPEVQEHRSRVHE